MFLLHTVTNHNGCFLTAPYKVGTRSPFHSQNHRITRVGRDPKDHVVPTPLPGRATKHPHSDQVAQDPVQPGLEHVQGRGIHNLPGQPVPGPNHSPSKELPPNIQPKSSLLQLGSISPSPAVVSPFEEFTPLLAVGSLQVLIGCNEVTPQPSLLQAEQAQLPQPVLIGEVLQPPDHLSRPPLDPFQNLYVFLVLRAPQLDTVLQVGPHKSRVERDNHLPVPAGHPSPDGAQDPICLSSCQSALLAPVKSLVHQDPSSLSSQAGHCRASNNAEKRNAGRLGNFESCEICVRDLLQRVIRAMLEGFIPCCQWQSP
ncbi:uncharacterized protein LOC125694433 [Lagopus muta]|uniref:uncharacterized protein LOC125694433 n=1 Tax=Lagopus muta TaxID=64668 RepID=UPI0020A09927|nr:uncharacterized protein LOC125694433 [Lagopus muta]XP_048803589.1 uncharacterized protein LOC125694433 [Lagopus muta]